MTTPDNKNYIDSEIERFDQLIIGFDNYLSFMKIDKKAVDKSSPYHILGKLLDDYSEKLCDTEYRSKFSNDEIMRQLRNLLNDLRHNAHIVGIVSADITDRKLKDYAIMGGLEEQEKDKIAEQMRRDDVPEEDILDFQVFGDGGGKMH